MHTSVRMNNTGASVERRMSIVDLNGLANSFSLCGNKVDALKTFDSAIELNKAEKVRLVPVTDSEASTSRGEEKRGYYTKSIAQTDHPSDSYLEGECDVGPRAIHQPIHFNHNFLPLQDGMLVEAVLLYNKGVVHHSYDDLDRALDAYQRALDGLTTRNSDDNDQVEKFASAFAYIATLLHNNIGQIFYIEGEQGEASYHFEAALNLSRQVYVGSVDRDWQINVANIASNYARTQWMCGEVGIELAELFRTVLWLRSALLPSDHPDVICAHLNLAFILYSLDDKQSALKHLSLYLEYAKSDESPLDPIPALVHFLLIENENKTDDLSSELVRSLEDLQEKREDFGSESVEVASLLNYIGTILFHRRELTVAIVFYKEELKLESKLAEDTPGICISVTYNNIGRIFQELNQLPEAINCYKEALAHKTLASSPIDLKSCIGTLSESTMNLYSTIWYNLGLIYDRTGSRSEAIVAFEMSLGLRQALLGADHPDVACLWYNIGTLQIEAGLLEAATGSLKEAVRIKRVGGFAEDPKKILKTMAKLASLQEGRGRISDALTTLGEMVNLLQVPTKSPSDDDCALSITLSKMSDLLYARGAVAEALAMAHRSLDALLRSDWLTNQNSTYHLTGIERVGTTMMTIGCLQHELLDTGDACGTFTKANDLLNQVVKHFGRDAAPSLNCLEEVTSILKVVTCAPQA